MIAWLDLETTGLSPETDQILEISFRLTDDSLCTHGFADYNAVIIDKIDLTKLDPVVLKMHTDNGLLADINDGLGITLARAKEELMMWVNQMLPRGEVPLAGNSVHFDRAFLRHHMPELERFFHHRNIDMSTLTELSKRWMPLVYNARPKTRKAHRAKDDVLESIEYAEHFKTELFRR